MIILPTNSTPPPPKKQKTKKKRLIINSTNVKVVGNKDSPKQLWKIEGGDDEKQIGLMQLKKHLDCSTEA